MAKSGRICYLQQDGGGLNSHARWQSSSTLRLLTLALVLLATQAAAQDLASQVVAPVVHNRADDLLPASKASFEEVRAANAELRASDASLGASNAKSVAVLKAAEANLQEIFPGTPGTNGMDGTNGPTGPSGALGQTGNTGGTQGGNTGQNGSTGQIGLIRDGVTGVSGTLGDTGGRGPTGLSGFFGISGLSGTTGVTGAVGDPNLPGTKGASGTSGSHGLSGTTGISKIPGAQETGSIRLSGTTGGSGTQGTTGGTGASGRYVYNPSGCYGAPVTLDFDEATIGGTSSPNDGQLSGTISSPFTYHGLTFSVSGSTTVRLANQNYMYADGGAASVSNRGFVSTPSTNLLVEASGVATLTSTTGGGAGGVGVVKAFSVFVGQPITPSPTITFTGYQNGGVVCGVQLPARGTTYGITLI